MLSRDDCAIEIKQKLFPMRHICRVVHCVGSGIRNQSTRTSRISSYNSLLKGKHVGRNNKRFNQYLLKFIKCFYGAQTFLRIKSKQLQNQSILDIKKLNWYVIFLQCRSI